MARRKAFGSVFKRKRRDGTREPGFSIKYRDPSGRQRWESGFPTEPDAARRLAEIHASAFRYKKFGESEIPAVTFTEFRPTFEGARTGLSPRTREVDEARYATIADHFGRKALRDVTRADVEDFAATLRRRVVKRAVPASEGHEAEPARHMNETTINRFLALVSAIFRAAIDRGMAERNPCRGVRRGKEALRDVSVVTAAELERLAAAVPADLRPAAVLAIETGCRRSELAAATWADLDLAAAPYGVFMVRRGKSERAQRAIPLTTRARAAVDALKAERGPLPLRGSLPLLPVLAGGKRAIDRLTDAIPRASKVAGLPRLRCHDLRHLLAVRLLRSGTPLSDVAKILGDSLLVAQRYARHVPGNAAAAAMLRLERSEAPSEAASGGGK